MVRLSPYQKLLFIKKKLSSSPYKGIIENSNKYYGLIEIKACNVHLEEEIDISNLDYNRSHYSIFPIDIKSQNMKIRPREQAMFSESFAAW